MYMRRQQRTAILRLLCAGIAITCCCLIGSYVLSAPHHVRAVPTPIPIPEGPTKDYLEAKRDPTHEEEQVPIAHVEPEQEAPKAAPKAQHTVEPTIENEAVQPPAPKKRPSNSDEDTDPSLSTTHTTPTNDDAHLKPALREILSLLPDEMHIRELTRPLEGTGKEKLREVGLRSRAYSTFFRAWEALHVVSTPTTTYIRDDILLYLRTADLSDISHLSRAEIMRAYEAYRYFLVRLAGLLFPWTGPYFASHMALHASIHRGGRGIVLSGNDGQTPFLLTGIKTIRELGCELPIEVMYLGDEDLSEDSRADLEAIPGVVTRDLAQMVSDEGWKLAGWAGKPFAILLSSFREAIFIDADALFFVSPETLFDEPSYQKTGALFFRDRLVSPESKKRWLQSILPKPVSKSVRSSRLWTGESGHQQESGVVVVDKWRHFIPLLLVTRMNGPDRDGNEEKGITGIYDMVYGDKETFWLGWELVGDLSYSFHSGAAGVMGVLNETSTYPPEDVSPDAVSTVCAPQLVHLSTSGRPLWFNGWLLDNKFSDKHKREKPGTFDVLMAEPPLVREPGAWWIGENNMCCLTADSYGEFTEGERRTLDMLIRVAREVGAVL